MQISALTAFLNPARLRPRRLWPSHISYFHLLLWVMALGTGALLLLPPVYLLIRALDAEEPIWQILLRPRIAVLLFQTIWLAVAVTASTLLIAVPLAWLTVRSDVPLRRMWGILAPLPLVIPSYVGAYLVASALGPRGLVQQLLEAPFGIQRLPSIYGFPGALFILATLSYPYVFLAVRGALLRLDPAQEEAARSLGDNAWQTFRRVTWPLLRPACGVGGLLVALYTLRDFSAVALMRYDTFTRAIYIQYNSYDRPQAALLALILIVVALPFVVFEMRLQRTPYLQNALAVTRSPTIVGLGIWRWPAFAFCASVILVSLIFPAAVLLYWLILGLQAGNQMAALGEATLNSIGASGLAALFTTIAALPVAWLVVRRRSGLTIALERLTYAAFALPGIVIALSLVFLGVNHARWLYQTLTMLIIAYGILFIPQAVGTIRSALMQIHPNLEEAAGSLGRAPGAVFVTITLPLLRSGLLAGAGMIFLTAMKELPTTWLLAPIGFKTLATTIWASLSEAFFAAAALPALLIILLSSIPMAFLVLHEQKNEHDHRPM
jgi:iron(III) transport system permease protein